MLRLTAGLAAVVAAVQGAGSAPPELAPRIAWQRSESVGAHWAGRLERGVRLPAEGRHFFTWDPILRRAPNRAFRRWGNDRLVRLVLRVLDEYATAHPNAPRVGIGDLSRRRGGDFGIRYGWPGHVSHQNGLDADVYYPRLDRKEQAPLTIPQVDRRLAQDLVRRFVRAGASRVFVGPNVGLTGPPGTVAALPHHDNHLHVRIDVGVRRTHALGRSERGRPIRAIQIGDPTAARKTLVVGCIHGNECAGLAAVQVLARTPPRPGVDLWLVPTLNPDGLVARTRQNANGVDLNRNFPAGWRRIGRPFDTYHSGPRPLSEREARIAAKLILRLEPRTSIWYHQHQALVRGWDGRTDRARSYARLVGLPYRSLPSPAGAATRWQRKRLPGSQAFVVELPAGALTPAMARRHAHAVLRLAR